MNKEIPQNRSKNSNQLSMLILKVTISGNLYHIINRKLFSACLTKKTKQFKSLKFKKVEI